MTNKKQIRQITGYTQEQQINNAASWFGLAAGFNAATNLLNEFAERIPSDRRPFALNAGFSLELVFKAVLAKKRIKIPIGASGHDLCELCAIADVKLSVKQMKTLELLTETVVWAGRYPAPTSEKRWDDYQDRVFEKHIERSRTGNSYFARANPETFPDWENYAKIWNACVAEYDAS